MKLLGLFIANLKQLHLVFGIVYLVVFWLSGAFLKFIIWDVVADDDLLRVLYRSSHVYILMSALINIAISVYLSSSTTPKEQVLQGLGSMLILISPLLLSYAFFLVPKLSVDVNGVIFIAVVSLTIGVILHLVSTYMSNSPTKSK